MVGLGLRLKTEGVWPLAVRTILWDSRLTLLRRSVTESLSSLNSVHHLPDFLNCVFTSSINPGVQMTHLQIKMAPNKTEYFRVSLFGQSLKKLTRQQPDHLAMILLLLRLCPELYWCLEVKDRARYWNDMHSQHCAANQASSRETTTSSNKALIWRQMANDFMCIRVSVELRHPILSLLIRPHDVAQATHETVQSKNEQAGHDHVDSFVVSGQDLCVFLHY